MRSIPVLAAAAVAALVLTACGGSTGGDSTGSTAPAAGANATVTSKDVDGVGRVLVDSSGHTLYAADPGTADGKVLCVDACTAIWQPLAAGSGLPSGTSGVGTLGVVTLPDGSKQVTVAGKPLYTFTQEGPGQVTGNGLADAFGGQSFMWHAVLQGGTTAGGSGASPPAYSY
jgi:predicted lipoprotein with Yx(FWY)xxD motif